MQKISDDISRIQDSTEEAKNNLIRLTNGRVKFSTKKVVSEPTEIDSIFTLDDNSQVSDN